ncbi:hypothetical protein SH580_18280 [Coraliomargarita algicola]|uniref:LamG-like jellyroll fold domain-containing protein n=1 Tax=Coraliomargarita algicola TaxID=3092156 RepID=A0ABZ0RH52_9BACT|nr:hypothetical protein [Coraliomargarita sp. J2-16]WPJ95372.1 hypothetical protein SH580_18280 [Coraliomargarita sp. J2-16]
MKLSILIFSIAFLPFTVLLADRVVASWDFSQVETPLEDLAGAYDLSNMGGVTFDRSQGALFNGGPVDHLRVDYSEALEPWSVREGETWQLVLTGLKVNSTGGYRAIYSSRDDAGEGAVLYINKGVLMFWVGDGHGDWNRLEGGSVYRGHTYNLIAGWDGQSMYLTVDDGATKHTTSLVPDAVAFNSGLKGVNSAIYFGVGGHGGGDKYQFRGHLKSAKIVYIPEASNFALLLGLASVVVVFVRRQA